MNEIPNSLFKNIYPKEYKEISKLLNKKSSLEEKLLSAYESDNEEEILFLEVELEKINILIEDYEESVWDSEPFEIQSEIDVEDFGIVGKTDYELIQEIVYATYCYLNKPVWGPRLDSEKDYAKHIRYIFSDYGYENKNVKDKDILELGLEIYKSKVEE